MGSIILIFRDSLVSARGYGRRNGFIPANAKEQLGPGNSTMTSRKCCHSNHRIGAQTCANHTVPYGTALLGWRCPRHFVPGYDRTVPPGHFATGFSWAKVILAGRAAFPTKRVGCCACRRPSYLSLLTSVCSGGGAGSGFLAKPDRGRPD